MLDKADQGDAAIEALNHAAGDLRNNYQPGVQFSLAQAQIHATLDVAAAIRESSGTDAGLRARALTAERERDKALKQIEELTYFAKTSELERDKAIAERDEARGEKPAGHKFWSSISENDYKLVCGRLATAERERDEARRQHHAACAQRDAAHERADRLQKQPDTRPTMREFADMVDKELARRPLETRHDWVAARVARDMGLVRTDDPAPTEQDDALDPWAPGKRITPDGSEPVGLTVNHGGLLHKCTGPDMWEWWLPRHQRWSREYGYVTSAHLGECTVATPEELAAAGIEVTK